MSSQSPKLNSQRTSDSFKSFVAFHDPPALLDLTRTPTPWPIFPPSSSKLDSPNINLASSRPFRFAVPPIYLLPLTLKEQLRPHQTSAPSFNLYLLCLALSFYVTTLRSNKIHRFRFPLSVSHSTSFLSLSARIRFWSFVDIPFKPTRLNPMLT